jgi:hypothetical protein
VYLLKTQYKKSSQNYLLLVLPNKWLSNRPLLPQVAQQEALLNHHYKLYYLV